MAPGAARIVTGGVGLERPGGRSRTLSALEVALITSLALIPRAIGADHPPYIDELYNVLAAQSLVSDGTLEIGHGIPYVRGLLHTGIVAGMFRLFGPGLDVARLPGILFGTALVTVIFLWVRSAAGRLEAWIAALLLAFYPTAIALSQIGRFYPAQVLLFWIGTVAVHRCCLAERASRPAAPGIMVAAVAFTGAFHLQPVSAVGVLGVLLAAMVLRGRNAYRWAAAKHIPRWISLPAGVAATGLGFLLTYAASRAWRMFNHADLWAFEHWSNRLFYHDHFLAQYGPLWVLLPVLLILAIRSRPGPAVLAGAIFLVALSFHSFAMWKNERYIHYAAPALFVTMGLGVGAVVRSVHAVALPASLTGRRKSLRALALHSATVAAAVLVLNAGAATRTAFRMATRDAPDRPAPYPGSDWESAAVDLAPALERASVIVASADLKALYFLGRLDFDLSADHLYNGRRFLPDFTPQSATGVPVIRSAQAVRLIVDCFSTGLFVIELGHWRTTHGVPAPTADLIENVTRPVPIPARLEVLAFEWRRDATAETGDAPATSARCPLLPAR